MLRKRGYRQSLRLRFTLACTGLVVAITWLFSYSVNVVQEQVDDKLLDGLMQREVAEYERMHRENDTIPPPRSSLLRGYVVHSGEPGGGLPPELEAVPPGIHHDILIHGRNFQVANFTVGDQHLYLTYDITDVERRELWLRWALILGTLGAGAAAAAAGWRLSSTVIAPVTRLAGEIAAANPREAQPTFARRFTSFEVGALARAFDAYLLRIGDFVSRERAFTEDASHELRTPITVIGTAAERILADPALPATLLAPVQRVQRASRQMDAVTQALLYMAREDEAHDGALRRTPAHEVVALAVENCRYLLAGKPTELNVQLDSDDSLQVSQGLFGIVAGNLLHNAIAHTAGGTISVSLHGGKLEVSDTGAGIAPQDLPHVFERRYRGSHSSGQGLGLHIVKRICDREGWPISVAANPGGGTVFSVKLDAALRTGHP